MLKISLPEREYFDQQKQQFVNLPAEELKLEHSLISLSRWESKWKKAFLGNEAHTREEIIDYIRCMSINEIPPKNDHLDFLDGKTLKKIEAYIADSHSATTVSDRRPNRARHNEIITSEVIYYWMIFYGIPFECQKWHLNRLLMLIKVCGVKGGTSQQQMDMNAIFAQNRSLNAARRAAMNSPG